MKKFQPKIYVKREKDGSESYLVATEDLLDLADTSESVVVGIYELVGTKTLRLIPELH